MTGGMNDATTPIGELRRRVAAFVRERAWEPFHSPKDLAAALVVEASELLEIFLWKASSESEAMVGQPDLRARVLEELADVVILACDLANRMGADVAGAVEAKLAANARKYPVERSKGSNAKYTEL